MRGCSVMFRPVGLRVPCLLGPPQSSVFSNVLGLDRFSLQCFPMFPGLDRVSLQCFPVVPYAVYATYTVCAAYAVCAACPAGVGQDVIGKLSALMDALGTFHDQEYCR